MFEPVLNAPGRVDFGILERGDRRSRIIEVSNTGRADLDIYGWEVTNDHFVISFPDFMDERAPRKLAPGETVRVQVDYIAISDEPDVGDLIIRSNDDKRAEFEVELTANVDLPCLVLDTYILDFGIVAPGESRELGVRMKNCSEIAATNLSVLPLEDRSSPFGIINLGELQDVTLEPGQTREMFVSFSPEEPGDYVQRAQIRSNAEQEITEVEFKGVGAPYECPRAVLTATNRERGVSVSADPYETYFGLPLDVLALDASQSYSNDGARIERVEWSLVRRPADSGAAFASPATSRTNTLFLDLSGEYTLELHVWNDRGVRSCEPAVLDVVATPDEDIHIQLVWDTPNDNQQFDPVGTDVDLHLLRQGGIWNVDPWDCFWQNLEPDWGERFDASDNPSLDIDDTDGWGPENINLNNPEQGMRYHVGVHYFSDQGFGLSYATLRLYLGGVVVKEVRRQRLVDQQFWHAFDILWPQQRVIEYNQLYSTFPSGVFDP